MLHQPWMSQLIQRKGEKHLRLRPNTFNTSKPHSNTLKYQCITAFQTLSCSTHVDALMRYKVHCRKFVFLPFRHLVLARAFSSLKKRNCSQKDKIISYLRFSWESIHNQIRMWMTHSLAWCNRQCRIARHLMTVCTLEQAHIRIATLVQYTVTETLPESLFTAMKLSNLSVVLFAILMLCCSLSVSSERHKHVRKRRHRRSVRHKHKKAISKPSPHPTPAEASTARMKAYSNHITHSVLKV